MDNYNPNVSKHISFSQRKSIRLKGYDYSQAGLYFITICCQNRAHLFGEVFAGKIVLNEAGNMVRKWYFELENKFPDIKCHEMIVMPNHFHCIFENVGADLRVCPHKKNDQHKPIMGEHKPIMGEHKPIMGEHDTITGEHIGSPLHLVVQWFKTMTTNEYIRGVKTLGWQSFDKKLWQRNYYEHIIRNRKSFQNISEYIINNPKKWVEDKFYS